MTHYKHILLVKMGTDIWLGTDTRNISAQTYNSALSVLKENGVLVLKYNREKPELFSLGSVYEQGLPACKFAIEDEEEAEPDAGQKK